MGKIFVSNGRVVTSNGAIVINADSSWIDPVKDGDKLTIGQLYAVNKNNDTLKMQ